MKHIFLAYLFIALLGCALLSVLSYGYGAGYVYLYWREWQIQSNVWMLFFILAFISLFIQLIWMGIKRYLSRQQRKLETVLSFNQLHPYEQLAVVWLLNAAQDQQQFIQQAFAESGLLKGIVNARLYSIQQHYDDALIALNDTNPMTFELAELQRIEIYLAQNKADQALTHLDFLNQHELSPWLEKVNTAYEQRLTSLWGVFALKFPWLYLRSTKYGHLDELTKALWLQQLLLAFEQATSEDLHALQQRYLDLGDQVFQRNSEIKLLWLKVLSRMPEMSAEHEVLAEHLLEQHFSQDVFYLWFQQQLLKQNPDYSDVFEHILRWEQKYSALPILSFAKWHVYMATQCEAEAEQLLALYPNDPLMSYLRIKSTLKGQDDLLQQLNLVFANNANFIEIKI